MKKTYILPLLALCLAGCVEDEGNYNYTDLNEIDIKNLESRYSALSKIDRLQISPDISDTFGQNLSDYSFKWHICHSNTDSYHNHTVIGEEKDLDWSVDFDPGTYHLYYTVTDNKSGLETTAYMQLVIVHPYTSGFLLLGNMSDGDRIAIDMLSMPSGMDTIMMEDVFDNSQLNLRSPDRLIYSGYYSTTPQQTLWLQADGKSYRLGSGSVFDVKGEFNELEIFDTDYPVARPAKMIDMFPHQTTRNMCSSNRGYITEDMILFGNIIQHEYFVLPVNCYSTNAATLFKPSPYTFSNITSSYGANVFYDMDDNKFCFLGGFDSYCSAMTDRPGDEWSWDTGSEGRELVYGDYLLNKNQSYAIMKDADETYYIYSFAVPSSAAGLASKRLFTVNKSLAADFEKASRYMFAADRTSIFYTFGNILYHYDFSRGYIGSHDFGEEITYLGGDYCSNGKPGEYFVATYSEQNKGTIYKMTVSKNTEAADFEFLPDQKWPTRLRIKDIEWKYGN